MEIKTFIKMLHNNNAIRLTNDYILFNDLELYNFETEKSIRFNNLKEMLDYQLLGNSIKHLIMETEEFYNIIDGGRDSSSGNMGGDFNHARDSGKGSGEQSIKYAAEFNVGGKNRSIEKTLKLFKDKYANADHEYGIVVDQDGFVHTHIEGGKHSVVISGGLAVL
jgi:hypothetical protein